MAVPKTPRALSGVASDVRARRYPRALVVAVVSWLVVGVVLLFSTVGAPNPSNQDRSTENAIDALNTTQVIAPTGQTAWWFPYLPVLGGLVVVGAIVLALGYGWARLVLALLGLVAVIALAQAATWLAVPAGIFFVIACVCGLLLSAHRYLRDGAAGQVDTAGEAVGEGAQG